MVCYPVVMTMQHKVIEVSAGIILRQGRILLCQRPPGKAHAGAWEFPGGKRELNETAAQCLVRECREELGISIEAGLLFASVDANAGSCTLRLSYLWASLPAGEPQCLEHQAIEWVHPDDLATYPLCPADASIVPRLQAALRETRTVR